VALSCDSYLVLAFTPIWCSTSVGFVAQGGPLTNGCVNSRVGTTAGDVFAPCVCSHLAIGKGQARLGDALIAQSCIDGGIPLLTRDRDFRAFAEAADLDLVLGSGTDCRHFVQG
jgi:hypothetical protein